MLPHAIRTRLPRDLDHPVPWIPKPGARSAGVGAAVLAAALLLLPLLPGVGLAQAPTAGPGAESRQPDPHARQGPGLVVMVTVDQLRADLLDRYDDLWTGGLRRLLDRGRRFTSASHAHAFTETAAGHATLATGTVPARHGIVANDWWEPVPGGGWYERYAVEDSTAPLLALPGRETRERPPSAGRSPRNLLRGGLAEWIRSAAPEARVVSVSKKDRAAITHAAGVHGHVYWIDEEAGRFVTSRWYRDAYPGWVARFNRGAMEEIRADTVWTSVVPEDAAHRSRPDTAAGEGDGVHTAFPHRAWEEAERTDEAGLNAWVAGTPAIDRAVVGLALEAVDALRMGRGSDGPDFLAVSLSQTDYVGHAYGPLSREQLDNLIRLDRQLERLFNGLDRAVGQGRWVLAFSSDHGVLDLPEGQAARQRGLRRLAESDIARLRSVLERHGPAGGRTGRAGAAAQEALARDLESLPFVAAAYPRHRLAEMDPGVGRARPSSGAAGDAVADTFAVLYRNSLREDRYPDLTSRYGVEVRLDEGLLSGYERGTTHGSPYWYDRHVPLIFLGPRVEPGASSEAAYTFDAAPTLADLAGIPIPEDVDGRVLEVGADEP